MQVLVLHYKQRLQRAETEFYKKHEHLSVKNLCVFIQYDKKTHHGTNQKIFKFLL